MFFYLRELSLRLQGERDSDLPLTKQEECVKVGDVLDLSKLKSKKENKNKQTNKNKKKPFKAIPFFPPFLPVL